MDKESPYTNYGTINESIPGEYNKGYYEKTSEEYNAMYKSYIPSDRNARILDIGCGKGFFLYYLNHQGFTNFWGIDADMSSIEHTKKHITEQCEYIFAEDFLSDKQEFYEFVIMNEVLEHLPKEQIIPLLQMIRKSLLPNGILICYVPNLENPFTSYTRYHDFTHTIGFTQNSLRMVMNAAGFSKTDIIIPEGTGGGLLKTMKKTSKSILRRIIKKILVLLFEYPENGIIHVSRIFSVAQK